MGGLVGASGQAVDIVAAQFFGECLGFATAHAATLDAVNGLAVGASTLTDSSIYPQHSQFGTLGICCFCAIE